MMRLKLPTLPALPPFPPAGSPVSRAMALGLLGLLLLLLWAGLVAPLIDLIGGGGILVQTSRLLQEQRRIAAHRPALVIEKAGLQTATPDLSDFLPAATLSLAAADLQSRLGAQIKQMDGNLTSIETLAFPDQEGFHRAGLRLKLSLRQEALPGLLFAVESGHPRLLVSALSIKAAKEGDLTVALDLFGYLPAGTP